MKNIILSFIITAFVIHSSSAQPSLQGTWKLVEVNGNPLSDSEMTAICSDHYFMFGHYKKDGSFISAGGGSYTLQNDRYQQVFDFHTEDSTLVRKPIGYTFQLDNDKLTLKGDQTNMVWQRIDESKSPLTGAWRFAARIDEDGTAGERRQPGPRQTIKILSGNRFQWAAFNYETKEFFGTGGGTYEASNGNYTENIQFFSRDNNRIGNSLTFQFERKGNDWYHKGKSSKGDPLHEIWEKVK